jgi:transposase InsO family protein
MKGTARACGYSLSRSRRLALSRRKRATPIAFCKPRICHGAIYRSSAERNAALAGWLDFYNRRRPHGALSHKPPIARLNELNNLLGFYS